MQTATKTVWCNKCEENDEVCPRCMGNTGNITCSYCVGEGILHAHPLCESCRLGGNRCPIYPANAIECKNYEEIK